MKKLWILLLLASLSGCFGRDPQITGREGKPLPIFSLQLSDSITYFSTRNIPAGKPAVLFYFGPHCPYCKAQMEEIIAKIDDLQNINFYCITTAPYNEMMEFYKQFSLEEYPNITVGRDYTEFFADYYEAPGYPFMAIYRKDKIMHEAYIGQIDTRLIKKSAE
jgi:thiol-disulfide isomerase/thioredoxin